MWGLVSLENGPILISTARETLAARERYPEGTEGIMRQRWSNSAKFWLVLIGTSLLATSLVVARVFYTGRITFFFLLWNLFFAWLPVLLAGVAERIRQTPLGVVFGLLWLLFLPNAPYLQYLRQIRAVKGS